MKKKNVFLNTPVFIIPNLINDIMYFPLISSAKYLRQDEGEVILKLATTGVDKISLKESTLFNYFIEKKLLTDRKPIFVINSKIDSFKPCETVLLLTDNCNLNCSYCFANSIPSKQKLNIEVALKAVDLILRNAKENGSKIPIIRFLGGGEPTIEWESILLITEYARKEAKNLGIHVWIRLITNGTLLNDSRLLWVARNIDFITLSFEVLPDLQKQRPYINGKDSHPRLIELVKKLSGYGIKYHIRTTISEKTVHRLSEIIEYIKDLNVKHIRFEPVSVIGRSVDTQTKIPMEEIFVKEFLRARVLGKKYNIDVTSKQFLSIENPLTRFCSAEFSIGPNETVTACHRFSREEHDSYDFFQYGIYKDGEFSFDIKKLNDLLKINAEYFKECESCFAKFNCSGGCLSARINNNVISKNGPLCRLTKELLKESILEYLN